MDGCHSASGENDRDDNGCERRGQAKTGIKLFFNRAGNTLLNQHGETNRTRQILADESLCETIIVIENHMTPSAMYADLLLPETSYLEAEDPWTAPMRRDRITI